MRQFTCPKAVTHPSTNRAQCRATALIETNALPLHQTANQGLRPTQTVIRAGQLSCKGQILWVYILSACGKYRNETVVSHLVKTYCLPRLLYGCEVLPFSNAQIHELEMIWNNAFPQILT